MAPESRSERFNLRLAEREVAMLNELAEVQGVSGSDVIRMLIRREHAEKFRERQPREPKKK